MCRRLSGRFARKIVTMQPEPHAWPVKLADELRLSFARGPIQQANQATGVVIRRRGQQVGSERAGSMAANWSFFFAPEPSWRLHTLAAWWWLHWFSWRPAGLAPSQFSQPFEHLASWGHCASTIAAWGSRPLSALALRDEQYGRAGTSFTVLQF